MPTRKPIVLLEPRKERFVRVAPTRTSSPDSDLTACEAKDLVKVGIRADVFYSIEDPEKCINKIDTDELEVGLLL